MGASPPGCGLTHTVTHMRKCAERAGCGRRPPGGKSVWNFGEIRGGRGESVPGGYVKGWRGFRGGKVYDAGVFPAPVVSGSLPSPR